MNVRTNSRTVSFRRPFSLSGISGLQPPGRYIVETDEEWIDGTSPPAYRRIATMIRLPGRPGTGETVQIVTVEPNELAAALALDAADLPADSPVPEPAVDGQAGDGPPPGGMPPSTDRVARGWRRRVTASPHALAWIAIVATGLLIALFIGTW